MALLLLVFVFAITASAGEDEIALFGETGKATAYIATDEENTIYSWGGKPLAYLESDSSSKDFDIYGFNGKHLGWFVQGVVRDHEGFATCAIRERIKSAQYEPYKGYKQYKPYKAYKQYAPYRPAFSTGFGGVPCSVFLGQGAA